MFSCRANMDVLVSMGTTASYVYSLISILHHHFRGHHSSMEYKPTDFFETSAMLITFILLGKYLEAAAKGRTSDAISALLTLAPPTALLLTPDADGALVHEEEVSTALIHRGDLLKVHSCFPMRCAFTHACSAKSIPTNYMRDVLQGHVVQSLSVDTRYYQVVSL